LNRRERCSSATPASSPSRAMQAAKPA
jgi:hypothetical protein